MLRISFIKKNLHSIILVLILCISFFLRMYKISQVPASLAPDEVALGYNAFSLLHTGMDEHGKFLPLSFVSFGDGKLPVYIYFDTLFIALAGLTELTVKIPSILSGVIATFLIFSIGNLLFKNKSIALFCALLYAVSPWNIYFSRMAYEANLATTLFLGGLYFYLLHIVQNKKNSIIISSFLFSLTIFTYHSYVLFTPLFFVMVSFLFRKNIRRDRSTVFAVGIFLTFLIIAYFSIIKGSIIKAGNVGIFNNKDIIYNRVEVLRGDNVLGNDVIKKVFYNKYLGVSYQIIQNYLLSFSPAFLFDKGGEKLLHNLGFFGNLYVIEALFILVGISSLFWNKEKYVPLLLIWGILGPIPSSITEDAPNTARLMTIMPLLVLISAYGFYSLLRYVKKFKTIRWLLYTVIFLVFFINVGYFVDIYFEHMNYHRARFFLYSFREAVFLSQRYPDYNIVVKGPDNFPYIYFLFYNSFNTRKFIKTAQYYSPTKEGFLFVKEFDRYHFAEKIDYSKLQKKTIYFDGTRLDDKKNSIFLPSGEPILGYYITQNL